MDPTPRGRTSKARHTFKQAVLDVQTQRRSLAQMVLAKREDQAVSGTTYS